MKKFREGSFLKLAHDTLGRRMRTTLAAQYDEKGTAWMSQHWGYCQCTIVDGLKAIGVPIKPKGHRDFWPNLYAKVEAAGGLDAVMKEANYRSKLAAARLGCERKTMCKLLRKGGFFYDWRERKWTKRD